MAKATYYNDLGEGKDFEILAKNDNGTLDIGTVDKDGKKTVAVRQVVIVDEPKPGFVTVEKPAAKAEKPKDPLKP